MLKKYLSIIFFNFFLLFCFYSNDYYSSTDSTIIHYDNENSGFKYKFDGYKSYEVGVHFINEKLKNFKDKRITIVRVYIYEVPDSLNLRFYNDKNLLYSQIIKNCKSYSWNDIYLDVPLTVSYDDLFLSIAVKTGDFNKPVIGLDNGPGFIHANLYKTDEKWEHLDIDKNWNIQAVITD